MIAETKSNGGVESFSMSYAHVLDDSQFTRRKVESEHCNRAPSVSGLLSTRDSCCRDSGSTNTERQHMSACRTILRKESCGKQDVSDVQSEILLACGRTGCAWAS